MKKIITIMLCVGAVATGFAQTINVKNASKLSGKLDKLDEARGLINQAIQNPETSGQAETYFVAGTIEFDAYDKNKMRLENNANDEQIPFLMAEELIKGYKFYQQALPLDSVKNDKGKIETKFSKKIEDKYNSHREAYNAAGTNYYNAKKYYPEAYEAFMIYGDLSNDVLQKKPKEMNPQQVATAYFNAGVVASLADQLEASAQAYRKSRLAGNDSIDVYRYETGAWVTLAQQDTTKLAEYQENIKDVTLAGIKKFGVNEPILINNYVNVLISQEKPQEAIAQLNEFIQATPDIPNLYGLRGWVYEQMDNDDMAEQDYRKGASLNNADFFTLKSAGIKLFKIGTHKLNELEGNSPEILAQREELKNNYFLEALKLANQANALQPGDSVVQSLLDSLDYAISTYF